MTGLRLTWRFHVREDHHPWDALPARPHARRRAAGAGASARGRRTARHGPFSDVVQRPRAGAVRSCDGVLHSFEFGPAIEGFTATAKADPGCAMAYWGIALGALEQPVRGQRSVRLRTSSRASMAITTGGTDRRRRRNASARMWPPRRGSMSTPTGSISARASWRTNRRWATLAARYPDDREASIFWALSLTASALPTDKTYANQLKAGAILEKLYPGAAQSSRASRTTSFTAMTCRRWPITRSRPRIATPTIAPSAPHALHMPSHTFTRVGAWQDSIDTNIASAAAARKANARAEELHATDYLAYAYLQTGQDNAVQALMKGLPEITAHFDPAAVVGAAPGSAGVFALAAIPTRWVLEHRDWKAAATLTPPAPSPFPYTEAMTFFARALGAAHTGALDEARASIAALKDISDTLAQANEAYWSEQVAIQRDGAAAFLALAAGRQR